MSHAIRFEVRRLQPADWDDVLRLRRALWPECAADRHAHELGEQLAHAETTAIFVAPRLEGGLGGFLAASLRAEAEGCASSPVGCIEGWYVEPDLRRRGVGAALVHAAEAWAAAHGCREMASDCRRDNADSHAAHAALGYREAAPLAHLVKRLAAGQ